jgi:hypothetical protein
MWYHRNNSFCGTCCVFLQVQELLLDQQHQIDLLLRGQSSLRGSMNSLRRSTMEKDTKTKLLHQQLEEQHGAALK